MGHAGARDQPRDRAGLDRARRLPARRVRALRPRLRPAHGDHVRGRRPSGEAAPGRRPPARPHGARLRAARHDADADVREVAAAGADREAGRGRPLGPLPRRRAVAPRGPLDRQVRRLPADAARGARRGVPHRDHRAAVRLGLDRGRSRGADGPAGLAARRLADARDPGVPRPDGHAEPHLRPRLGGRHRDRGAVRRGAVVPAGRLALPRRRCAVVGPRGRGRDLRPPRGRRHRHGRRPLHRGRRSGRPGRGGLRLVAKA